MGLLWFVLLTLHSLCVELWSPEQRDAAAAKETETYEKYMSAEHQGAIAVVHDFKARCEERGVHYADAFLSGDMTPTEYKEVSRHVMHLVFIAWNWLALQDAISLGMQSSLSLSLRMAYGSLIYASLLLVVGDKLGLEAL
jgi:hypothetical protein